MVLDDATSTGITDQIVSTGSEVKFILRLAIVSSPVLVLMMRRGLGTSLGCGAGSVRSTRLTMVNYI